jgi:putative transposase
VRVTIALEGEEVILMKGRRHTPEQIVRKLREAERLLAEGADIDSVCRHLEVSVQTYQRWRSQFKAMRAEDVVRLKALEKENARLKRLLAEKELDNDMLREVARGNW